MSEEPPPSEVLGSLPRTRPHRRSEKRADRPTSPTPSSGPKASPKALETPDRTGETPGAAGGDLLAGAVRTAAELAELGLTTGARALRAAVSRLPRP